MNNLIKIFFISTFIFFNFPGNSQQYNNYELRGSLNNANKNGTIYLTSGFIDPSYYAPVFKQLNSVNINGEFCFKGNIPYPHGVRFAYGDSLKNYYSGIVFIEPGKMDVVIDLDSNKVSPEILNSKTNKEYKSFYLQALSAATCKEKSLLVQREKYLVKYNNKIPDSLLSVFENSYVDIQNMKDSILLTYVHDHPNSYEGLWVLIENYCVFGYKQIYYDSFQGLSETLKTTYSGQKLGDKLDSVSITNSKGNIFPSMKVTDNKNRKVYLSIGKTDNRYVLIDFWASYCGPCIRQFEKLKKIYNKYNSNGFEIISVSIDEETDKCNWLALIKKHQLKWSQYWDIDGIESKKMSINAIPINYLLDEKGKIITKNISMEELEELLSKSL